MNVDCIVIGAGIIGLAVTRHLAMAGREVVILEAADTFGTETSSRNSEVIHAGIYYPQGSLKARLCVAGKVQLYDYCLSHGVSHKKLGKLIVATSPSEVAALKGIQEKAIANGVCDLEYLSQSKLKNYEPDIRAEAALFSPSTGIIDSHSFMVALLGDAEAAGAMLAVQSRVVGGNIEREGIRLRVQSLNGIEGEICAKVVVNAAGLTGPTVAASIQGMPEALIPKAYYCKGTYFTLGVSPPFRHLIYPVPNSAGLGVHLTLDLAGQARFGPDTEWVTTPSYDIDPKRGTSFYDAIRQYWPALPDNALQPGYVGMRPKIAAPNQPTADFMSQGEKTHGVRGLVNLFGIESPGLTASLALAEHVALELSN
jgi:L-2-hydroxyglutarate oxidase LhgO